MCSERVVDLAAALKVKMKAQGRAARLQRLLTATNVRR